ncbi:hypothetical protein GA0116996_101613 [Cupriavidus alkaliphilus]|nr:hypothetical protein GA0116996_101613 [Cupriavidus alkaliphilus]
MREIKTADEIRALVQEAADRCEDCADAHFGGVYWHEPDETGCNWSISTMRGTSWKPCFDCVQPAAVELRAKYNLPEPE